MDALRDRQAHFVTGEGNHLAPVKFEDLYTAERPAEALLFEAVKVERHKPLAVCRLIVDAAIAGAEQSQ
jgi:hypothetical protein